MPVAERREQLQEAEHLPNREKTVAAVSVNRGRAGSQAGCRRRRETMPMRNEADKK